MRFYVASAFEVIPFFDSPNTTFYLDPPYIHETRVSKSLYRHEMTLADHERLIDLIRTLKGRVLLSGYAHPLYDSLGWHRTVWDMPCNQGQTAEKSRREEVLWDSRR
jgi:DNA adenine methylase